MSSLARLKPYLRRYWPMLAGGVLATILMNFATVGAWKWVQWSIDQIERGVDSGAVVNFAFVAFAIFAFSAACRFLMRRLIIGASRLVEFDFRNDIFAHLQKMTASYYHHTRTGDLMSRLTNDLDAVRMVLGPGIMYPVNTLFLVPVALVLMIQISPLLSACSLLPMIGAAFFVRNFGRIVHKRFRKVQDHYSEMSSHVQENLSGIRVVKSFAREDQEIEEFGKLNETYRALNMDLMRAQAMYFPLMRTVIEIGLALIAGAGAWMLSRGPSTPGLVAPTGALTFGEFFAFVGLYQELVWPMIGMGWVINIIERGAASMKRINEVTDVKAEIPPPGEWAATPRVPEIQGRIEFRNLTFGYDPETVVLRDIDIVIEPGDVLGVVGPVGCGKSTLLSLIPRLYSAPRGMLFIDGHDVNDIPIDQLREAISIAPQETFLFSDTIRENIELGAPDPPADRFERAAENSQIAEAVKDFPKQYETMLGERGINLSGGQKQRTALARAILRDPKILLLDDSLSAVDTQTEELILKGLRNVMAGRTTVLVSHRVSTVALADEIVVLSEGRIVERGTHQQLIALDGAYAELRRRQQLTDDLELADEPEEPAPAPAAVDADWHGDPA